MSKTKLPPVGPYADAIRASKGCQGVRTSETLGSCYSTDISSYLKLIVRKITEKCGTCQELMNAIRRVKLSDNSYVTPNEFRYTLIKFGVTLPQSVVDAVFNVFDSDRSGTMDFDEFSNWIMNADVKPYVSKGSIKELSAGEKLRKSLNASIAAHPQTFQYMKKKTSFMELVSDVNRLDMPMKEKDVRAIFLLLDPQETGFVDSQALMHFAKTGSLSAPKETPKSAQQLPLEAAVNDVTGRNPRLLIKCFCHVPKDKSVKMSYDEFRQSLLSCGLGLEAKEAQSLFLALGGKSGLADIDMLWGYLSSLGPENALDRGRVEEPVKITKYASSVTNADLRLRELLRKGFKDLKHAIEDVDSSRTGFIGADKLHGLINKHCGPLCFADYRLILKTLPHDDSNRVQWQYFIREYNPTKYAVPLDSPNSSSLINTMKKATSAVSISDSAEVSLGLSQSECNAKLYYYIHYDLQMFSL